MELLASCFDKFPKQKIKLISTNSQIGFRKILGSKKMNVQLALLVGRHRGSCVTPSIQQCRPVSLGWCRASNADLMIIAPFFTRYVYEPWTAGRCAKVINTVVSRGCIMTQLSVTCLYWTANFQSVRMRNRRHVMSSAYAE